ncbi:MAG: DUF4595 domain-containing protein [Alistipes sp.]|jgi:hypothetical protein|nr:DUF4595 domain-containing protein [Alistipes sp.]
MKKLFMFALVAMAMSACTIGGDDDDNGGNNGGGNNGGGDTPAPSGDMRYVSSIHSVTTGEYENESFVNFSYDSNGRVVSMTNDDYVTSFAYSDGGRTVTVEFSDGDNGYVFRLNSAGAVESVEVGSERATITYNNGFLDKINIPDYEEDMAMTWSGGNQTAVRHNWLDENGAPAGVTNNVRYNSSWANNLLCNLDLNAFIFEFLDGFFSDIPAYFGLLGKRSQHMISSVTKEGGSSDGEVRESSVVYDSEGFVTKITVEDDNNTRVIEVSYE